MKQTITGTIFMEIKTMDKNIKTGGVKKYIHKTEINKLFNRKCTFRLIIKFRRKNKKMATECLSFYLEENIHNKRDKKVKVIISTFFNKKNYS